MGFAGGLFFVPLNAFLQERAGIRRRAAYSRPTTSSIPPLCSSLRRYCGSCTIELRWSATAILGALGVLTLIATVYVVSVLPADVLRLVLFGLSRFYFRIRVVGVDRIPASGAALLISNHVSYADAALIGCCTHRFVRFLMWKPIFDLKLAKPFFKILQAIPINAQSPKETVRALRQAATS